MMVEGEGHNAPYDGFNRASGRISYRILIEEQECLSEAPEFIDLRRL